MAEPVTMDASTRYAFAPSHEPIEGVVHRIRIVFEASDGRVWTAGTDMMALGMDSAEDFCDALNAPLGLSRDAWTAFAERVFAAQPQLTANR
jgi:hypothetical protein